MLCTNFFVNFWISRNRFPYSVNAWSRNRDIDAKIMKDLRSRGSFSHPSTIQHPLDNATIYNIPNPSGNNICNTNQQKVTTPPLYSTFNSCPNPLSAASHHDSEHVQPSTAHLPDRHTQLRPSHR